LARKSGAKSLPALSPLLPKPKKIVEGPGSFLLDRKIPIVLSPGADESSWTSATVLRDAIERACRIRLPIEAHLRRSDLGPQIALGHGGETSRKSCDRYRIEIRPDAVELRGSGAAGLRYAVETATQLLGPGPGKRNGKSVGSLPVCEIEDEPDFAMRGVMLDISRGKVPTLETLLGLVDVAVKLKLNTLMLYTEHIFRFRRHPTIGADASPLDAETLRKLDQYAAQHHVELVPCLQSLGHMDHILALPRYRELAETERGFTIAPTHPGSRALLRDLYDEYLPNFRSAFMNANCDEPFDLGLGQGKARSAELGPGGLYLEHVGELRELASRHGKRTMIWGDFVHAHPKRIPEIPDDIVMLDWWYEAEFGSGQGFDRVKVFKQNKLEFLVCPGTSSWNCLFPRVDNSTRNIANWAAAGRKFGALGLINTDWGDWGHYNLLGNSWYAYAVGAQQSWSGDVDKKSFDRAFSARLFGENGKRAVTAGLYCELGDIHDAGFKVFNGSPIQYLFFDTLEESYFISNGKQAALEKSCKKLARVRAKIDNAKDCFREEKASWRELLYAADASLFALEKTLAAKRYNSWRRKPKSLATRDRKRLALRLRALARLQGALLVRLQKLWLARSAISNFDLTEHRIKRSIQSLRTAAGQLEKNTPPGPVKRAPIDMEGVLAAVRRSFA
jgi:hypothetical protein